MKKSLIILLLLLSSVMTIAIANQTATDYATGITNNVALGFPDYGWAMKNSEGQVTGFQGLNAMLGFSVKFFFSPLKYQSWNAFWGWGTALIFFPVYLQIGGDYMSSNGFYMGLSLTDFIPSVEFGGVF